MDARAEKELLAQTYAQTYPTCGETGGLMPVRMPGTHLKIPLLITIPPPPPPRVVRREYIIDEEAQARLLSEYKPFTQCAAIFCIFVGLLVSSAVIYMAVLVSVAKPPHNLSLA
ncbi:hypothetical protein MPH_08888 [Macrophomina phaseolina MS6]|uniref:Uncharacterized protein n=1 Tax=Macrophomina phaseolina (strain MS6) TaxID=1126212 RepID=K2RUM4_MACPH|nr:hypothetical protein MPH_08888 [Macrophomina phaseolina MS6]